MEIRTISEELKKTYGQKIYRLSLSSGCTCPNRDGLLGTGGCTFCSEGGSGDFAASPASIPDQIRQARKLVDHKIPASLPMDKRKYIAYFQSFTNTYGDTDRLAALYHEAISQPEILALSIGTRPDCLEQDKIDMLRDLHRIKPVWVELGLQTIHEETAVRIHRGYPLSVFEDAYRRLTDAGLTVIVHVILGLPDESHDDMVKTCAYLAGLSPTLDGIKLQLLHVLKGTALAQEYEEKPFHILSLEEYSQLVVDCLRVLPPQTVVHRITGDGPKSLLIEPQWSADKKRVLNTLHQAIRRA